MSTRVRSRAEHGTPQRGMPLIRMGEVGRHLVPVEADDIVAWFLDHLLVARGFRQRLAATAAMRPAGRWLGRALFSRYWTLEPAMSAAFRGRGGDGWEQALARCAGALAGVSRQLGRVVPEAGPGRCIFVRDSESPQAKGGLLVFIFAADAAAPAAVVKVRPAGGSGSPLRAERQALEALRRRLPPELRARVPQPLAFERTADAEALAISCLPGRSAHVDLHRGLDPERRVRHHFAAALAWLVPFHLAARIPGRCYRPEEDDDVRAGLAAAGGALRGWQRELLEGCARSPVPLAAGHGDFRPDNVLLPKDPGNGTRDDAARVVDWESFSAEAPPFHDLFSFATTYGLEYPWSRDRRSAPAEAFRLTYFEDNPVSREVRRFLLGYCERTGLDTRVLAPLAHVHLLALARRAPADQQHEWLECHRMLERAGAWVLAA